MMLDRIGRSCDRVRFPYVDCVQCGFCEAGCKFDRNRSLLHNYLPAAENAQAVLQAEARVQTVEPFDSGWRVRWLDSGGALRESWGRIAVIAAGALETPAVLLRSAASLPGLSAHVGQHLSNNGDVPWYWMLPEGAFPSFSLYKGRNNAGVITYGFWSEHRLTIHTGCSPPALISALDIRRDVPGALSWGLEHKHLMGDLYRSGRMLGGIAIGLVEGDGEVRIDSGGAPSIDFPMTERLKRYTDRVLGVARQIAEANGAELLRIGADDAPLGGAHQLGTCRMGGSASQGVVDSGGEVFGASGLFVSDGSTLPGGTGVNPALTIAANAERIAAEILRRTA